MPAMKTMSAISAGVAPAATPAGVSRLQAAMRSAASWRRARRGASAAWQTALLGFGAAAQEAAPLLGAARQRHVPIAFAAIAEPHIAALYQRRFVLVRPDGHVAWRDDRIPQEPLRLIDVVRGAAARSLALGEAPVHVQDISITL